MINFDIITIFPKIFDSYLNESILKRARQKKLVKINVVNLRDFSALKHKKVDDRPYGGGPGMVLMVEPIEKAVRRLLAKVRQAKISRRQTRVILFSTRGRKLDQRKAKQLSRYRRLILICGRYEGVDERVARYVADEEISLGDFVLSGGELPALALIEAASRFVPGVLGKYESLEEIKGYYPVYTRPENIRLDGKRRKVPAVLLQGDHQKIAAWRLKQGRKSVDTSRSAEV
jgi:tRNA (guanine37-N1)-methyltransferase